MSDTVRCTYCQCVLTIGGYDFTGHTEERCKEWTLYRVRDLEKTVERLNLDLAVLRDMMGRHVCPEEKPRSIRERLGRVNPTPGHPGDPELMR